MKTAKVAKDLGVDNAAGAGRCIPSQRARISKVKKRPDRLARIRGPVRRKATLSVSFLQTAALYGEEVVGFRYVASGPLVRSSYKAGEFFIETMLRDERKAKADAAA